MPRLRPLHVFIVATLVALLAFVTVPLFSGLRHDARDAVCRDHLRQWHSAWISFAFDNDGRVPSAVISDENGLRIGNWITTLAPYMGFDPGIGASALMLNGHLDTPGHCPAAIPQHGHFFAGFEPRNYVSYGYNTPLMGYDESEGGMVHLSELPGKAIVIGDSLRSWNLWTQRDALGFRHDGWANIVLVDGSIYRAWEGDPEDPPGSMWGID